MVKVKIIEEGLQHNVGEIIEVSDCHAAEMIELKQAKLIEKVSKETIKEITKLAKGEKEEEKIDLIKPKEKVDSIDKLKKIILENFPTIWFEMEAALSSFATLSLTHLNGCPALTFVGNPSGEKTTIISLFYGYKYAYLSDEFSPRAFVSHSVNVSKADLAKIDLLPKIKNKCLLTPELAPLFEAPKDQIINNFAILTRILDGEGYSKDTGAQGHRGYLGDYKFVWLGASTPLRSSVWGIMGKIGNRLFFLNMREKNRKDTDFLEMFQGKSYEEKLAICRGATHEFLDSLFQRNGIRNFNWNTQNDILILPKIINYAKILASLRASLMTWKGEERGEIEYNFPIKEEPPRAINSLYNFAKGRALIYGRDFLKEEDLELIREICLSSMPHDRFKFLQLLMKYEGRLTSQQIEKELGCSNDTALRTMKTFEVLGIVKIKTLQTEMNEIGRPLKYIELNPEFSELLTHTQNLNGAENTFPHESNPVRVSEESVHD